MNKLSVDYNEYREKYPFSSSRKRMSIVLNIADDQYLFVKGASEMVLNCCTKWFDMRSNKIEPIC